MNQHNRYDFDIDRYQFIEDGDEVILVFGNMKQSMPKESLASFIQDLTLDYSDMELSGYPHVDAIIQGNAKFLGKGADGIVFQSLGDIVKVSTTIPFNPMEQFHRTPQQAIEHTRKEANVLKELYGTIDCVLPIEYVEHGGRAWIIKPYLEIIEDKELTEDQYQHLERCVSSLHENGYAIGDTLQFGIGNDDKAYFLDLGQASLEEKDKENDIQELYRIQSATGYQSHMTDLILKDTIRALNTLHRLGRRYKFDFDALFDVERVKVAKDNFDALYYSLPRQAQEIVDENPKKIDLVDKDWLML
jgi:hypothetical protein